MEAFVSDRDRNPELTWDLDRAQRRREFAAPGAASKHWDMKNVLIRPLEESDAELLRQLVATGEALDPDDRTDRMLWTAFRNPHADGRPTYLVAERDRELVGHLGRAPTAFSVQGRRVEGCYWHDLFVSPAAREKGLGYFLATALYEAMEKESQGFCGMVWANEMNRQLLERRGYHSMEAETYVKILDATDFVTARLAGPALLARPLVAVANIVGRALDLRLRLWGRLRLDSEDIERFDQRFDALANTLGSHTGIGTMRDSAYLNWKWVDRPSAAFTRLGLLREGELVGLLVLGVDGDLDGRILDVFCNPNDDDVVSAVFGVAIDRLRAAGARSIHCLLTDPRYIRIARKSTFLARASTPVWLRNLDESGDRDMVGDVRNWHLTYGESDFALLGA